MSHGKMRCIRIVFFVLFILSFTSSSAHGAGGLSITEIMYDPAGADDKHEWVEVYNSSSTALDLAGYFILTDGIGSTKHSLVAQTSSVIPAGGYAVIVQDVSGFKADFPTYAGLVFDSSWSGLTSSVGKTIVMIDGQSVVLDQSTYDPSLGGTNNGDSLQKNLEGVWSASSATPGVGISTEASTPLGSTVNTGDGASPWSESVSVPSSAPMIPGPIRQKESSLSRAHAELMVPVSGVAGVPVSVSFSVFATGGDIRTVGITHIAFGDGSSQDGKPADSFSHIYEYPGTYVVSLSYRLNTYMPEVDISARTTIQVLSPSVSISGVGADGAIELMNTGTIDSDVSGWILAYENEVFQKSAFHLPQGTIILPGKKIVLSSAVTNLTHQSSATYVLALSSGRVVSKLSNTPFIVQSASDVVPGVLPVGIAAASILAVKTVSSTTLIDPDPIVPVPVNTNKKTHSVVPYMLGLCVLVLVGGVTLYKLGFFAYRANEESQEVSVGSLETEEETPIRIIEE